jgi:hypothetical protein
MAEIEVRRRRNPAVLTWAIILLVGLGWLIYALSPQFTAWQTRSRLADPITDLRLVATALDAESIVGRRVEVRNARVVSVTGDRTFWIDSGSADTLFVVLDEQRTPGTATEGRYDVNAGQMLDIRGRIERFPGWDVARSRWNIDPTVPFEEQRVYVAAEELTITMRP